MKIKINNFVIDENDPIVFLDIDGVLNFQSCQTKLQNFLQNNKTSRPNLSSLEKHRLSARFFDKASVQNLEIITFSANAWVIISSDWQHKLSVEDLRYIFRDYKFAERIIDKTEPGDVTVRINAHGKSILNSLERNQVIRLKIALDDCDLSQELGKNFVNCAADGNYQGLGDSKVLYEGLSKLSVSQCIEKKENYSHLEEDPYENLGDLYEFFQTVNNGELQKLIAKNFPAEFYFLRDFSKTCLHIAAKNHHKDMVRYFITCGVPINARDENLETPLHYFMKGLHFKKYTHEEGEIHGKETLEILIEAGADPTLSSHNGFLPINYIDNVHHAKVQAAMDFCMEKRVVANNAAQVDNSLAQHYSQPLLVNAKRKHAVISQNECLANNVSNCADIQPDEQPVTKQSRL